ncbi:MAG: phospholipase D family protein [Pseudomonadota bacterium]
MSSAKIEHMHHAVIAMCVIGIVLAVAAVSARAALPSDAAIDVAVTRAAAAADTKLRGSPAGRVEASIIVGFSRGAPSAKEVVLAAIADARKSIHLAAYQFTHPDIVRALIAAKKRGVQVAVVLDRTQANGDSQAAMVASGIACRIDGRFRIMHHKFIVVDGRHVETGSFNYSVNADKVNAENALYLKNVPELAAQYKAQWDAVYAPAAACAGGGQ